MPEANTLQQWEYKTFAFIFKAAPSEEALNSIGDEGWELVTILPSIDPRAPWLMYFKRPKTTN